MKKILVTGGLGYIGSHTVIELLINDFEVIIIDDLSNSFIEVLDKIFKITGVRPIFVNIDLKQKHLVIDFFKKHSDLDGIIHFAASKSVVESVKDPLKYYENNIIPLTNILYEIKNLNKIKLIFSSSCTVYGQSQELPITENTKIKKSLSPYGNTKKIGEDMIEDSVKSYGNLNAITLRYFNPIGAHNSSLIGELPIGIPQNLVPFITQTAIGHRDKLLIYGNDYPTPDGTCIRDYIHVVDLANAHVKAIKQLLKEKNINNYEVYNIGTGKGSSVLEVVKTFEEVSNKKLNYLISDRRQGDVTSAFADNSKAKEFLGWEPKYSLKDALFSAWEWEKNLFKDNKFLEI